LLGFIDPAQKELQQRLQNSGGKCRALTLTQIKQATENFKTTIGIGGFGKVYYGKLVNGQEIAVKTLSTTSHQTEQEFFNEVTKFYSLKILNVKSSKKLSRFICLCLLCQMNSYVIFTIGSNDLFLAD
jgi:RIO-like serine/threonine protein kinase